MVTKDNDLTQLIVSNAIIWRQINYLDNKTKAQMMCNETDK